MVLQVLRVIQEVLRVLQAARTEITQDLRALLVLRDAWEYLGM